ncbi:outer membrane lipoprotein carrier protein LolA [Treponema primitia ZAS-2]|uniref:Outer membrane lipoprotein carrier protein LolA n=1 Tax=Treponema primitia (strain ATCC BAA-887 / DSM 12427 / ZAS-2) TaxID=545694 RepID=F5YGT4_TREPZ|nr:outer membrane lipoprotein carrier protein LolA [Treponema primitia]AEF84812.1 outer membrane lipoprotein carrier protein LolA [Treponema primitia ZAS-2]
MGFRAAVSRFFVLFLSIIGIFRLSSQEIITAERYLETVSERYGAIRDYEARITIYSGNTEMFGTISHLSPSFLRIDFTKPSEQVIAFNGETLTVYLPEYRATLNQSITPSRRSPAGAANLATAQGLALLRRNYIPSFVTGPDPAPLETGSDEQVVKLRLSRRSVSEGFREIILNITPTTHLIRRIEGRTIADVLVRFDFSDIKINQGIPEQRFIYDSPASANNFNNFLFSDTD